MKVLHILALGGAGGIESLSVDVAQNSLDDNYFYFLWGGGKNAERIANMTSNIQIRNFKMKNIVKEYKHFEHYCLENAIDCIVVQGVSPMMVIFATIVKAKYPKIKEILYMHNDATYALNEKKKLIPFKIAYRYCDGCIAISNYVKESIKAAIGDNNKVYVIYNGVNVNNFPQKKDAGRNNQFQMIYVGRLIKEKGVENVLRAMTKIAKGSNCRLTIVGDGPERDNLKKICKQLQLNSLVEFVGMQWNISSWLQEADVFVHACSWNEGFGITLVEAMASGVPCIAFDKGAISEIIDDGVDGFVVKQSSVEALAQKILEVETMKNKNQEQWKAIQREARKKAEKFSVKCYVNNLSSYLKDLEIKR